MNFNNHFSLFAQFYCYWCCRCCNWIIAKFYIIFISLFCNVDGSESEYNLNWWGFFSHSFNLNFQLKLLIVWQGNLFIKKTSWIRSSARFSPLITDSYLFYYVEFSIFNLRNHLEFFLIANKFWFLIESVFERSRCALTLGPSAVELFIILRAESYKVSSPKHLIE